MKEIILAGFVSVIIGVVVLSSIIAMFLGVKASLNYFWPDEPVIAEAECFQGWMIGPVFQAPMGWASLSDTAEGGNRMYLCSDSGLHLTSGANGAIMNLPRFDDAQSLIDSNLRLRNDNERLMQLVESMRTYLEELN